MSRKGPQDSHQPRVVGNDEMFTVYRTEGRGSDPGPPAPTLPFRDAMVVRLLAIELRFMEDGWPPFGERVEVGEDGNSWRELPAALTEELEAQGLPPQLEVPWEWHLGEAPVRRFEYGMNFIIRRVEPLTQGYWLIEEAGAIRSFLDASDVDGANRAAYALGELMQKAHLHRLHLPAVRKRRKQAAPLNDANRKAKVATVQWKLIAQEIAAGMWARNPTPSAHAVATKVCAELKARGVVSARGAAPAPRSIRGVISDLRPRSGSR